MNKILTVPARISVSCVKIDAEVRTGKPIRSETGTITKVTESDYNKLKNRPSIESVTLEGNHKIEDLGVKPIESSDLIRILD